MPGHIPSIAIVGCGHAARRHAANLVNRTDAELTACFDAQREAAETFGREFGAAAFDSLDALLDSAIDAVIICTPPTTHIPIAQAVLERGLRVLCEKPLAPTVAECHQLSDTTNLACAFKFRHMVGSTVVRDYIAAGHLGRVLSIRSMALSDVDMTGRWFSNPALSGGGVLLDNGVHLIDLCHFLVGQTDLVTATTWDGKRGLAVEESASMRMQMSSGPVADIFVSWEAPAPMPPLVEIWGSEGYVRLGYDYQIFDAKREIVREGKADGLCVWRAVIDNFVAYLHDDAEPMARFEDGLTAVAVVEAAYRSAVTLVGESPNSKSEITR